MLSAVCHLRSSQKKWKLRAEKTPSPNSFYVHGDRGCGNPNPRDIAETMARSMDMRRQQQHNRNMWYGRVKNDRLRHKQLAAAKRGHIIMRTYIHGVANCCCCAARLYVALCSPHVLCCLLSVICDLRKNNTTRTREKNCLSQSYVRIHGDRRCANPGIALKMPKAKKVKRACHARRTARIAPKPLAT